MPTLVKLFSMDVSIKKKYILADCKTTLTFWNTLENAEYYGTNFMLKNVSLGSKIG